MKIEIQPSDELPHDWVTVQEADNGCETQLHQLVRMFRSALLAASFNPDSVNEFFKGDEE